MRIIGTILFVLLCLASYSQVQILGIIKSVGGDAFINAVIVCDGNSLTRGYQASNPPTTSYPARLQQSSPFNTNGATVTNKGVDGQTTANMASDAATDIDPLYNSGVKSILVAWECGNDLYFTGDATACYNRFVSYCNARRAAGWKVVAVTVPYRDHSIVAGGVSPAGDNDAAYNTKRQAINSNIVANWATFADALADIASDSGLSSYNTTNYNADRVHFNDTGYSLIASLILPVILSL